LTLVERDVVRLDLAGKKRPGVVLRAEQDRYLIIYGTTVEHDLKPEPVAVHKDVRQGKILQLSATTYFYGQNVAWATPDAIERLGGQCSILLYLTLRELRERVEQPE
jgi:hypothetical protein